MQSQAEPSDSRFDRLRAFADRDPGNMRLLADAASAAIDEGRPEEALSLLDRRREGDSLGPELMNLKGLAALHAGRAEIAAEQFSALREEGQSSPEIRFNLAAAKMRLGHYDAVAELIDEDVMAAIAAAAPIKVRALHHLGRLEEALALGRDLAEKRSDDAELMGALASIALDAEQTELARAWSDRAGGSAEGLAARGTLLMNEGRTEQALAVFRRAVDKAPGNARAALGLGMALLAGNDVQGAIGPIEQAAEAFGDHPGSWLAAGWAHWVAGDSRLARLRFERALECDESFAESHGALAVVDVAEGRLDEAKRRIEIASRLDRACFSAALARVMLLEGKGQDKAAAKVRAAALGASIDGSGRTLGDAIASLARRTPKG